MEYKEPELTFLVLDYRKEAETRQCLLSIREHTKFPHKIIYLHNGNDETYPYELFKEGLLDQIIQTKKNSGLGIGTRDLFAASFSPYSYYLQNDQYLSRDFTQEEFDQIKSMIGSGRVSPEDGSAWTVASVDLAGGVCGLHTYSERAHITATDFYKYLEREHTLSFHGAGPYHNGMWREEQLQKLYRAQKWLHFTYESRMVVDNGHRAIRQNPDGSKWEHKADTRELRLLSGPVSQKHVYPNFTDAEWSEVIRLQSWPEWKIPEKDIPYSYHEGVN